jgi:hypothetical protein
MTLSCNCGATVERQRNRSSVACDKCQQKRVAATKHVNNDGAEHRKKNPAAISLAPWLVSHGFPEGYQVLCFNCNIAKGINGRCPHEQVA